MSAEPIASAARSGDRVEALAALRDRLAVDIDACKSGRDMAALSRQLVHVLAQLAEIEASSGRQRARETGLSQFERRLQARSPRQRPRRTP